MAEKDKRSQIESKSPEADKKLQELEARKVNKEEPKKKKTLWGRYKETKFYKNLHSREGQRNFWGYAFITPSMIIFILFTVIPIILGISLSVTNAKYFDLNRVSWVGLKNFRFMFQADQQYWDGMRNIMIFAVITVPLTLTFSMILALIVKKPIFGTKFFRGLFYLPGITSGVAIAMVWAYMFDGQAGILNNMIESFNRIFSTSIPKVLVSDRRTALSVIIFMTLWGNLGGNMVLFLAGMNAIPTHLYEAADIDGASKFRQFFQITLPLMKPSINFALTLSLIGTMQMFEPILIMGANTTTPVYEIYNNATSGFAGLGLGYASAQAMFLFIIIMVMTFAMQKLNKESYF